MISPLSLILVEMVGKSRRSSWNVQSWLPHLREPFATTYQCHSDWSVIVLRFGLATVR